MRNVFVFALAILFNGFTLAKGQTDTIALRKKTIEYISNIELDSAKNSYNLLKERTKATNKIFEKLINHDEHIYKEVRMFFIKNTIQFAKNPEKFIKFLQEFTPKPEQLYIEYVINQYLLVQLIRNEGNLDLANVENEKLKEYVEGFESSFDKERAKIYCAINDVVMLLIQKNIEKGMELSMQCVQSAIEMNDSALMTISLYHYSDFLAQQRNMDAYISTNERCFEINRKLHLNYIYRIAVIENLLDVYIYSNSNYNRIEELLDILLEMNKNSIYVYVHYINYLKLFDAIDMQRQNVYKKFGVSNSLELTDLFKSMAQKNMFPKYYAELLGDMAGLLQIDGFYQESNSLLNEKVEVIQKLYSEDLSKSIAAYRTEQAMKTKNLELKSADERFKLLLIIMVLVLVLLLLFVLFFINLRKKSAILRKTNAEIQEQRDKLQKADDEKAMLLKEIHHRVKNNFQIVSSLLELQIRDIEDEKAKLLAEEGRNRIKSMAIIHQRLYQNDNLEIEITDYIRALVADLASIYDTENGLKFTLNSEKINFDIDTAIPLGLILNELVTNAYKYGFDSIEKILEINIKKMENGNYKLMFYDNGKSSNKTINFENPKTLGLRLVKKLSKQLMGTVQVYQDSGTVFEIIFKDTLARHALL